MNRDFVGREAPLHEIKKRFELEEKLFKRECRRVSLYGLGGVGLVDLLSFCQLPQSANMPT